ncbi:hypothetical protein HNY73_001054 [Argiope bruennichi]|uniref:Uncharacterized protein n=1 Tax=Argiope bruennichi TaxID=94029 RepID=A0A8T0G2P0_ARGBR|nr:hypothetical protein HNY73_001054 [Argiope bruennichi]
MNRFQFATSFGLVVKTKHGKVVMIERKVPYCVQNYMIQLYNKKILKMGMEFTKEVQDQFEREHLPKLSFSDRWDYYRYLIGLECEDQYDFPHGQMTEKLYDEEKYYLVNGLLLNGIYYFPAIDFSKMTKFQKFQSYVKTKILPYLKNIVQIEPSVCSIRQHCVMLTIDQVNNVLLKLTTSHPMDKNLQDFASWFWSIMMNDNGGNLRAIHGNVERALSSPYFSLVDTPVFVFDLSGKWSLEILKNCIENRNITIDYQSINDQTVDNLWIDD